jgi:hypothetical protein
MELGDMLHGPAALSPRTALGTHVVRGWVGPPTHGLLPLPTIRGLCSPRPIHDTDWRIHVRDVYVYVVVGTNSIRIMLQGFS